MKEEKNLATEKSVLINADAAKQTIINTNWKKFLTVKLN